ncbi:hypothetical protein LTR62_007997 [Meristemomyces frigidus]|uniref:Uncharacterized protein n=1 Tax=Meristemomyces frigidus TaxID=1508187 RepID=A0AAN7TN64_9PEZI|nr:hypothetical protein LTR62_007997 [Meristemomyces frigidus]
MSSSLNSLGDQAQSAGNDAQKNLEQTASQAENYANKAHHDASQSLNQSSTGSKTAGDHLGEAQKSAQDTANQASNTASDYASSAQKSTHDTANQASKNASETAEQVKKSANETAGQAQQAGASYLATAGEYVAAGLATAGHAIGDAGKNLNNPTVAHYTEMAEKGAEDAAKQVKSATGAK